MIWSTSVLLIVYDVHHQVHYLGVCLIIHHFSLAAGSMMTAARMNACFVIVDGDETRDFFKLGRHWK